jgi:hypothetical protein
VTVDAAATAAAEPASLAAIAIDAGDLPFGGGLLALVRPALARLSPGGVLAVLSSSPSVAEDLPAWCRIERHDYLGPASLPAVAGGPRRHLIARGPFGVVVPAREHGAAPTSVASPGAPVSPPPPVWPARADVMTGFAPRGSISEPGAPAYPFTLLERDRVVPPEVASLYQQAVAAAWDGARDIPWDTIGPLSPAVDDALCQIMTFLAENELSALYVPARFPAAHPSCLRRGGDVPGDPAGRRGPPRRRVSSACAAGRR